MQKLIGLLLIISSVVLFALPALSMPQGKARLSFSGQSMPAVDFPHEAHKGYVPDCKTCHHMGVGTGGCVDCHGDDNRARSKQSAFHDSCQGCHTKMRVSKNKDCKFCHNG